MNVSIIGAGYVGLVTGACLADRGHRVVCVDADAAKVASIEKGASPFHEPGLDEVIRRHVGKGLRASTNLAASVLASDMTLVATGTPFDGQTIDLTAVKQATKQIGEVLAKKPGYHSVIVKSTVVPGTTDSVVLPILEEASRKKAGRDFGVGMNPEFLSEGRAVEDFMDPDRIVIGGIDDRTLDAQAELYESFKGTPTLRTNNSTAEFIKYTSNSLLATLISFSNEIANLCSTTPGVDAIEVMKGVHLMRELTHNGVTAHMSSFLLPGCGFGGSCLPKDVKALSAWGLRNGQPARLLESVLRINQDQPARLVALLERGLGTVKGKRIAVLGLAFKPDTDDLRETPAVPLIDQLLTRGATVRAHDPVAVKAAATVLKGRDVALSESLGQTLEGAEAVVIVTRWKDYQAVPGMLKSRRPRPLLVDGRRMLDRNSYDPYTGIGLA